MPDYSFLESDFAIWGKVNRGRDLKEVSVTVNYLWRVKQQDLESGAKLGRGELHHLSWDCFLRLDPKGIYLKGRINTGGNIPLKAGRGMVVKAYTPCGQAGHHYSPEQGSSFVWKG